LKAMQSPCLKKLLLLKNFRTARFHVAVHDTACSARSFVVLHRVTSVALRKPTPSTLMLPGRPQHFFIYIKTTKLLWILRWKWGNIWSKNEIGSRCSKDQDQHGSYLNCPDVLVPVLVKGKGDDYKGEIES
jgi:hypothetical protein